MDFKAIVKQLAEKENVSVAEIENEMQNALNCADLNCDVEEFIKITASIIQEKTIYSKIV